jgi:hypothetical protein
MTANGLFWFLMSCVWLICAFGFFMACLPPEFKRTVEAECEAIINERMQFYYGTPPPYDQR